MYKGGLELGLIVIISNLGRECMRRRTRTWKHCLQLAVHYNRVDEILNANNTFSIYVRKHKLRSKFPII